MWKCTYIETSAKNNRNIEAIFEEILELEQQRALYLQSEEDKVGIFIFLKRPLKILWLSQIFQNGNVVLVIFDYYEYMIIKNLLLL